MNSDFFGIYISVDDLLITIGVMAAVLFVMFILLIVNMGNMVSNGPFRQK